MTSFVNENNLLPEVRNVRTWLEEDIAGRGICPPLARLMNVYRDNEKRVDWERLSPEVDIFSFRHIPAYTEDLVTSVTTEYLEFISRASVDVAPFSMLFILPDFESNLDYDKFMIDMKVQAFMSLYGYPYFGPMIKTILAKAGIDEETFNPVELVEGIFNPVYFYGHEVTERDIADLSDSRGPRERNIVLSRAPYYLTQVVNPLRNSSLTGSLDKGKLRKRNTDLALRTDIRELEARMKNIRS